MQNWLETSEFGIPTKFGAANTQSPPGEGRHRPCLIQTWRDEIPHKWVAKMTNAAQSACCGLRSCSRIADKVLPRCCSGTFYLPAGRNRTRVGQLLGQSLDRARLLLAEFVRVSGSCSDTSPTRSHRHPSADKWNKNETRDPTHPGKQPSRTLLCMRCALHDQMRGARKTVTAHCGARRRACACITWSVVSSGGLPRLRAVAEKQCRQSSQHRCAHPDVCTRMVAEASSPPPRAGAVAKLNRDTKQLHGPSPLFLWLRRVESQLHRAFERCRARGL